MALTHSELASRNPFAPEEFKAEAVSAETDALNQRIVQLFDNAADWWTVGAQFVRDARAKGEGALPVSPKSDRARTIHIDGPAGRKLPLRVIAPEKPAGVYLHIHGGGMVLGAADQQDLMLERIAGNAGLACVSVEYRLAPENPYPAPPDDCEAAALWLAKNARTEFGTEVLTIGGESAGATLSAVTLLRMRDRHGFSGFRGANLVFGAFDLSLTPSMRAFGNRRLVLRTIDMQKFMDAYLPGIADRLQPDISPLYADLRGLPPALFTVGTADGLLDDSLFMYARWIAAGNHAELAIYPGGAHAFVAFPGALAQSANARIDSFLANLG